MTYKYEARIRISIFSLFLIVLFSLYFLNQTDCSCLENLSDIKEYPNYKFVKGNICSSELVSYVLEAEKIDTIMHFAAQTHVDNSFGNSFQFTQVCNCSASRCCYRVTFIFHAIILELCPLTMISLLILILL